MQTGFLQFDRDEAIFYFSQQRALMLVDGSWDYGSITAQSPFEIGIFPIPLPTVQTPNYGKNTLGPPSEAGQGVAGYFFLTRQCAHPREAIDFLQYLTSVPGNQRFVDRSKWLPSVRNVTPLPETAAFFPRLQGYPSGFHIAPIMWGSGEMYRLQVANLHILFDPDKGVGQFVSAIRGEFNSVVNADATRLATDANENVRREDSTLVAALKLAPTLSNLDSRSSAAWQTQNYQEAEMSWLNYQMQVRQK
jgi:ABC-type glycerol-3-phosphate transport system substrate-binding protein